MTEESPVRSPGRARASADAVAAVSGLAVTTVIVVQVAGPGSVTVPAVLVSVTAGIVAGRVGVRLCGTPWPGILAVGILVLLLPWSLSQLLVTSMSPLPLGAFGVGALTTVGVLPRERQRRILGAVSASALVVAGTTAPAQAWSIDEPKKDDPKMVAGNGIVPEVDTHAFLLASGVAILEGDGRTSVADFLNSADPSAPAQRDKTTLRPTAERESYLWRMQRGSRDADRSHKPDMPDHFFNWWTHSGKGLVAGPSAAEYAEEQYAQAVKLWKRGDRSKAMYHLGAATHLVQDGCTPPHASFLVPEHRSYEDWIITQQPQLKTTSGGIYRDQFRVKTGHGGPDWSSSHTRGWVDECAHRAAQLIPNVMRPPTTSTVPGEADGDSVRHLHETQQLTAGYLAFFFDEVGGP